MKVKMISRLASPKIQAAPGSVIDVDEVLAKQLVASGAAEAIDKIDHAATNKNADSEAKPSVDDIKAALDTLDHADDSHWTKAGKPAMAAVEELLGANVSAKDVEAAYPGFVRKK